MSKNIIKVGLFAGRHPLPVGGYVFNDAVDPMDFSGMADVCAHWVESNCSLHTTYGCCTNQCESTDVLLYAGDEVALYVTGLTAAVAAFISVCALNGVPLVLWHYNAHTGEYMPQRVL